MCGPIILKGQLSRVPLTMEQMDNIHFPCYPAGSSAQATLHWCFSQVSLLTLASYSRRNSQSLHSISYTSSFGPFPPKSKIISSKHQAVTLNVELTHERAASQSDMFPCWLLLLPWESVNRLTAGECHHSLSEISQFYLYRKYHIKLTRVV